MAALGLPTARSALGSILKKNAPASSEKKRQGRRLSFSPEVLVTSLDLRKSRTVPLDGGPPPPSEDPLVRMDLKGKLDRASSPPRASAPEPTPEVEEAPADAGAAVVVTDEPDGDRVTRHEHEGAVFWHNASTGTTHWTREEAIAGAEAPVEEEIVEATDEEGRVYFVNLRTHATGWTRDEAAAAPAAEAHDADEEDEHDEAYLNRHRFSDELFTPTAEEAAEEARAESDALREEVARSREATDVAEAALAGAREAATALSRDLEASRASLAATVDARDRSERDLEALRRDLAASDRACTQLRDQLGTTTHHLTERLEAFAAVEGRLSTATAELAASEEARAAHEKARGESEEARAAHEKAHAASEEARAASEEAYAASEAARAELHRRLETDGRAMRESLETASKTESDLRDELAASQAACQALQAELETARGEVARARSAILEARRRADLAQSARGRPTTCANTLMFVLFFLSGGLLGAHGNATPQPRGGASGDL